MQWDQLINVYGVNFLKYEYINTCEVYELEVVLSCLQTHWWKSFAIELIDKPGEMIPSAEIMAILNSLKHLQKYLEVKPEQFREAMAVLSIISNSKEREAMAVLSMISNSKERVL